MKVKLKSIESKLKSIQNKLKSIESKLKSIQNKLKSIESKLKIEINLNLSIFFDFTLFCTRYLVFSTLFCNPNLFRGGGGLPTLISNLHYGQFFGATELVEEGRVSGNLVPKSWMEAAWEWVPIDSYIRTLSHCDPGRN